MCRFKEGDRVECKAYGKGTVLVNNITEQKSLSKCVFKLYKYVKSQGK